MAKHGAFIIDTQRQIRVLTPIAEEQLGWENDRAAGLSCPDVFDCRDEAGNPLCDRCGMIEALSRREMTKPATVTIADATGARRLLTLTFWYLPPTGTIPYPRLLGVVDEPE